MKKSIIAAALAAVMLLSGCSKVREEDYYSMADELENVKAEMRSLQSANSSLQDENAVLKGENEELKPENDRLQKEYDQLYKEAEAYLKLSESERAAEMERLQKEEAERKAQEEAAQKAEEAKGYETGITFENISRSPDKYKGKKVKFSGYVLQVIEGYSTNSIRMSTNGRYDDVILVEYKPDIIDVRLLEDDELVVYGTFLSMKSYTTVVNSTVTVPAIKADIISLDGEINTNPETSQPSESTPNTSTYPVLYNDQFVSVSFCGVEKKSGEDCVVYMVENKTDFTLEVWDSTVSFDGFDLGEMSGSGDVSPKSKGKVYFYKDDRSGIDNKNPSTVSGSLTINDKGYQKIGGKSYYKFSFSNVSVR